MGRAFATLLLTLLVTQSVVAEDDYTLKQIEESGGWGAFQHLSKKVPEAPDACLLINVRSGIAFRLDKDVFDIRVLNEQWNLPDNVRGSVGVTVGAFEQTYPVATNDRNMVIAAIPFDDTLDLLDEMQKGAVLNVAVGKVAVKASLVENLVALTAFRTCAGFADPSTPGSNPFE